MLVRELSCRSVKVIPDHIGRRVGRVIAPADAIVRPASTHEAMQLLTLAAEHGFSVTAAGGASNVVGAFDTGTDKRPRVIADMTRMNSILEISTDNRTVTVEAGILLPTLRRLSQNKAYTGALSAEFSWRNTWRLHRLQWRGAAFGRVWPDF